MPRTKNPIVASSKRPRTDEAGPSRRRTDEVLMKATFINDRARDFYHSSIVKKKCIPERGIDVGDNEISDQIDERDWEKLVQRPEAAVVPVVREFYANAKEQHTLDPRSLKSLVRGKWVKFDRATINAYYGLISEGPDDYTTWLEEESDAQQVLEYLTIPGGKWNMKGEEIRTLSKGYMTLNTKAWHYFICGKLIPSYHFSDATKDRALLNYAIQMGLSIDVGRIIELSIVSYLTGRVTVGLGHPSLIYQLCLKAGVHASEAEEVVHPSPTIDDKMLRTLARQPPPVIEAGDATGEAGPSSAPKSTRRSKKTEAEAHILSPPQSRAAIARLERAQEENKQQLKELRRQQRSQSARIDHILHEQRLQFEYVKESMSILATMIQGGPATTLPSPPHFPVYPPPTPSASSAEEEDDAEQSSAD